MSDIEAPQMMPPALAVKRLAAALTYATHMRDNNVGEIAINHVLRDFGLVSGLKFSERPLDARHAFNPHPKYPWFCADCGYAEHERLRHLSQGEQQP